MDLATAFKSEVFRPLVTLILPGATALAPYVILLREQEIGVRQFWNDHTTAAFIVIALAAIAIGRIFETLGARIEALWDEHLENETHTFKATWYRYLRLTLPEEPIGQRYLRTVTLSLKFELGMVSALPACYLGILLLECKVNRLSNHGEILLGALFLLGALWFLAESWSSVRVLARVRAELVDQFYQPPPVTP